MHEAGPGEGDDLRLRVAPPGERGCPLLRAAQGIHFLAGHDDAAVDQARHEGREFVGNDRDHCFVEECKPGIDVALLDQRAPLQMQGAGDQIGLLEAPSDRCSPCRRVEGAIPVAFGELLLDARHQEIAALDAVGGHAVQESLGARKPAGRGPDLPSTGEAEAKPERHAHGPRGLPLIDVGLMATLQSPQAILVPVRQVCRHSQALEVFGSERAFLIDPG